MTKFIKLVQVAGTKAHFYLASDAPLVRQGYKGKATPITDLPKGVARRLRKAAREAGRLDLAQYGKR